MLPIVGLTGCATATLQEIQSADFGAVPENYQASIQGLMSSSLKDPESARYKFEVPVKGFSRDGFLNGGKKHFGWFVPTSINAKNSYGAYAGEESYVFFFFEGMILDVTEGLKYGMAKYIKDAP